MWTGSGCSTTWRSRTGRAWRRSPPVAADVPLDPRAFAHWSVEDRAWVTGTGGFTLAVGRSVLDLRLTAEVAAP